VQQEQREQPQDLGLARHQPVQQPGQRHGLGRQVTPGRLPPGAGQVALVEDEVDDRQHFSEPARELIGIGHAHVGMRRAQRLAGPQQPLGHRGLAGQERGGDLGGAQAAYGPQRERDLRLAGQRGVAAGEDHAKELVVSGPAPVGAAPVGLVLAAGRGRREQCQLLLPDPGPAQPVDGLAAGGGRQPAGIVGRLLAVAPVLDRLEESVLHRVGGEADVADPSGEGGGNPRGLQPVDLLELSLVQDLGWSAGLRRR